MSKKKSNVVQELREEIEQVNRRLRDEARALALGTKDSVPLLKRLKESDGNAFTPRARLELREYVRRKIEKSAGKLVNRKQVEIDGARKLETFEPITAKRYMDLLLADEGPFRLVGDMVGINPFFAKPDEGDYWNYFDEDVPEFLEGRQ